MSIPGQYVPFSQEKGSSDYDIRHTLSGAISYNISAPFSGFRKAVLGNWSMDSIIYPRSAPPVNVVTGLDPFPAGVQTGAYAAVRPNVVPGVPVGRESERGGWQGDQRRGIRRREWSR